MNIKNESPFIHGLITTCNDKHEYCTLVSDLALEGLDVQYMDGPKFSAWLYSISAIKAQLFIWYIQWLPKRVFLIPKLLRGVTLFI